MNKPSVASKSYGRSKMGCLHFPFIVLGKVKPEETVQATLSSLPDEVVDIVGVIALTLRSTTFQLGESTVQYPMNVTMAGNLVNIRTGIINTTVTGTVYSDNQLAVYQVDRVLLPLSFFVSISPAPLPSKPVKKAPSPVSDESASSTDASVQASGAVPHRALNVVMCFAGLVIAVRVHSFRCCSNNNNNNNNNKPKPTQTPQLLKIAVTGLTELLRLFSSGQDRMDIVNDVQRYEVSVSSIDDVVMILNSDYENAYFVTALLMGIDKAVPKRILDMMNVEKLTRENVASHLKKYLLYLKRISCVASQQANIVAALGGVDSAYLQMSSLNRFGNYRSMTGSTQFQNATVGSFSSSGMLGRLNTPAVLGSCGLSSTGMIQSKFQPVILPRNQNGNTFQGMPTSLEFDQLQHNNSVEHFGDLSTGTNDSMVFPISGCGSTSEASFVLATWKLRTYLRLPWRPLISVDGSTIYDLDDKFKIVRHAESWDISALEAIGQIFTPSFGRPSE
ncbi:unnamed protein product [Camellia sinensis]